MRRLWEAIRRHPIRVWLGLGLIAAGLLGLADQIPGPSWSWSRTSRWFLAGIIVAFGLAGMIRQGSLTLGLSIIVAIGLAIAFPKVWVWFVLLVIIGILVLLEPPLRKLFRRLFRSREPEQESSVSGSSSPSQ